LSSISALAEFPERVKKIFLTNTINSAGCYAMRFYVNGEVETVVVDDLFPYNPVTKNWAFSRSSTDHEIWVLLLEKAWAKMFGSYQRIEGGTTGEALPALTGAPAIVLTHEEIENKESIWNQMYDAD
jgi:calpain-15